MSSYVEFFESLNEEYLYENNDDLGIQKAYDSLSKGNVINESDLYSLCQPVCTVIIVFSYVPEYAKVALGVDGYFFKRIFV